MFLVSDNGTRIGSQLVPPLVDPNHTPVTNGLTKRHRRFEKRSAKDMWEDVQVQRSLDCDSWQTAENTARKLHNMQVHPS